MKPTDKIYKPIEIEQTTKRRIDTIAFNNDVTSKKLNTEICKAALSDGELLTTALKQLGVEKPNLNSEKAI